MKMKVRKTMSQVAWDVAKTTDFVGEPAVLEDGYVLIPIRDLPSVEEQLVLDYDNFPLVGKEGWEKGFHCEFRSHIQTDENSVHRGEMLPKDGFATLDCDDFVVIFRQWVTDPSWWFYKWDPIGIVADPS